MQNNRASTETSTKHIFWECVPKALQAVACASVEPREEIEVRQLAQHLQAAVHVFKPSTSLAGNSSGDLQPGPTPLLG
eukprot:1303476-Pleurochrysis_carterae.AAC.1